MYWTHLTFVLLYGFATFWHRSAASKPGYLDFDNLPETNFSCDGKVIGGYYADVETGCQMFHVCTIGQKGEVTDIKFLCLNGTVFDQETRVCERIDEVDCSKSEDFFGLNLELYGNSANFGIQPENEFESEDASTDETDDEYEESEESTTYTSTTTTTTTTTTTPRPTTTSTTTSTSTARPTRPPPYQPNQDTIAALLAFHNAFNQGLHGSRLKPAPPRLINNAFSPTKPTPKTYAYTTNRPHVNVNFKSHYTPDSQSYGSLNLQHRERPYFYATSTEKSNFHHFQSGDTNFGHSLDATRPYNFQYFHSRKLPEEEKPAVSVVTSTSTSTSVKTSKPNTTEYPTGYDDYQDDVQDSFFDDVPKLRQKREEIHSNHKYPENDEVQHKNHKYDDIETNKTVEVDEREEFLQNLLGSIDLEDQVREQMTDFFQKEDGQMGNVENTDGFVMDIGKRVGEMFTKELNMTGSGFKTRLDKLTEWKKHFEDMKKDISLNYTFETNLTNSGNKIQREKREANDEDDNPEAPSPRMPSNSRREKIVRNQRTRQRNSQDTQTDMPRVRVVVRPNRRRNGDTENIRKNERTEIIKQNVEDDTNRRRNGNIEVKPKVDIKPIEVKPVSEAIQDDLTTVEYRRASKNIRSQPRTTASLLRSFKFNYEITTAISIPDENFDQETAAGRRAPDVVREADVEYTTRPNRRSTTSTRVPSNSRVRGRQRHRIPAVTTEATTVGAITTQAIPRTTLIPDPNFSCEGKVKGGFYSDLSNSCRGFFICSQGEINGPLLKSHFWCGDTTKFNQRSRTCQAEANVECSVSARYYHLNNDFLVPVSEDELKGGFEPMKVD